MATKDVALGALHDGPRRRNLKADAALDKRACRGALNIGVSLGYALRAAARGGVWGAAGSLCLLKELSSICGCELDVLANRNNSNEIARNEWRLGAEIIGS